MHQDQNAGSEEPNQNTQDYINPGPVVFQAA